MRPINIVQGNLLCSVTDSNVNLTQKRPHRLRKNFEPDTWALHAPVKLTHKSGRHNASFDSVTIVQFSTLITSLLRKCSLGSNRFSVLSLNLRAQSTSQPPSSGPSPRQTCRPFLLPLDLTDCRPRCQDTFPALVLVRTGIPKLCSECERFHSKMVGTWWVSSCWRDG